MDNEIIEVDFNVFLRLKALEGKHRPVGQEWFLKNQLRLKNEKNVTEYKLMLLQKIDHFFSKTVLGPLAERSQSRNVCLYRSPNEGYI